MSLPGLSNDTTLGLIYFGRTVPLIRHKDSEKRVEGVVEPVPTAVKQCGLLYLY